MSPVPTSTATSLPAFLAGVCADFSSSTTGRSPSHPPRILPSELSLLQRELDSWVAGGHHVPGSYSYAVTRVVATFCLGVTPRWEAKLRQWVLESSPRYGVKVNVTDADHILVLLWLLLKAMAVEARYLLVGMQNGDNEGLGFDPRAMRFECPRLVEGLSWLGIQLGVLYGESNGKLFALVSVKEAVLQMAYCLAVCVGDGAAGVGEDKVGAGEKGSDAGDVVAAPVFLSQVAASIVALYERFYLEEKTKALQAQRLSKYQLYALLKFYDVLISALHIIIVISYANNYTRKVDRAYVVPNVERGICLRKGGVIIKRQLRHRSNFWSRDAISLVLLVFAYPPVVDRCFIQYVWPTQLRYIISYCVMMQSSPCRGHKTTTILLCSDGKQSIIEDIYI